MHALQRKGMFLGAESRLPDRAHRMITEATVRKDKGARHGGGRIRIRPMLKTDCSAYPAGSFNEAAPFARYRFRLVRISLTGTRLRFDAH
jgi:hypothetical protein